MATTYYLRTTDTTGLTPAGENWTRDIDDTAGTPTEIQAEIYKATTEYDYAYSVTGVDWAVDWDGTWTVYVEVVTAGVDTTLDIQLARVNSGGSVQDSFPSSGGAVSVATIGTKTFTFPDCDFGTSVSTDHIRLQFVWVQGTHTTVTVGIESDSTYIDSPIVAGNSATGAATIAAITSDGTGKLERRATGAAVVSAITSVGVSNISRDSFGGGTIATIAASGTAGRRINSSGAGVVASITASGIGLKRKSASGSATISVVAADGTSTRALSATGAALLASITSTGSGACKRNSNGSASISSLTAAGTGYIQGAVEAAGAAEIAVLTAAGVCDRACYAAGAGSLSAITAAGSAYIGGTIDAEGAATIPAIEASGLGTAELAAIAAATIASITASGSAVTEIVKIVDPDNGDGTDYTTLSAWETAYGGIGNNGDCVGQLQRAVADCRCTGGTADQTPVSIAGWTSTDVARYIKVWTDPALTFRHNVVWPTGNKYRLLITTGTGIIVQMPHVFLGGLAISVACPAGGYHGIDLRTSTNGCYIDGCYIKASSLAAINYGITSRASTNYILNTVVADFASGSINAAGIYVQPAVTLYVANVTLVGNYKGIINEVTGVCTIKNALSFGNSSADYEGTFDGSSTHNGYTNGKAGPSGGSNSIDLGSSGAAIFRNYSSGDFHLRQGSPAYQAGTDLRTDTFPVVDDIDGQTRLTSTFDLGADDMQAWGAATIGTITASGQAYKGVEEIDASGEASISAIEASGTARRELNGSGAATVSAIAAAGAASLSRVSTGSATIAVLSAVGATSIARAAVGSAAIPTIEGVGSAYIGGMRSSGLAIVPSIAAIGVVLVGREATGQANVPAVVAAGSTRWLQAKVYYIVDSVITEI